MAELSSAVNELIKGKRVSENLPVYTGGLMALYNRMAHLRLALNYYTFSEIFFELSQEQKSIISGETAIMQQLMKTAVLSGETDYEEAERTVVNLRNGIIGKMEVLTAYTDKIQLYEYILNRVEFRFNSSEYSGEYYRNGFEKDIYNYVINDKDNAVVNMKLSMVMGELPMRLSRNKFFDILKDSFSIYKENEKGSVKDFAYRIKTAGGICTPAGMEEYFPVLNRYLKDFESVDYNDITKEQFEMIRSEMDLAGELATEYADAFVLLTEVINDMYSIILCRNALYDTNEKDKLLSIISQSFGVVEGELEPDTEWALKFSEFEGLQEKIGSMIFTPESTMEEIYNINEKMIGHLGADKDFKILSKISRLQSTSTFASLEDEEELKETADDKYINDTVEELITEFSSVFDGCSRYYKRAVMAAVISNVPAFFNNLEEFKSYTHVALSQCNDEAEQKACMTLINMMITNG